jgi:hypothetical protein
MPISTSRTRSPRPLLTALVCSSAILLAACGGDDGSENATDDLRDQIAASAERATGGGDTGDDSDGDSDGGTGGDADGGSSGDSGPAEVQPPTFVLTGPVEAPDGWTLDPANCGG